MRKRGFAVFIITPAMYVGAPHGTPAKDKPPVKRQVNRKVCDDINTDIKILSTAALYKGGIGCG